MFPILFKLPNIERDTWLREGSFEGALIPLGVSWLSRGAVAADQVLVRVGRRETEVLQGLEA